MPVYRLAQGSCHLTRPEWIVLANRRCRMKAFTVIFSTAILIATVSASQGAGGFDPKATILCGATTRPITIDPDPGIFGDTVSGASSPEEASRMALANLNSAILAYHASKGYGSCATTSCTIQDACVAKPVVDPGEIHWVGPNPSPAGGWDASASLHGWFDHDTYQIHCTECE